MRKKLTLLTLSLLLLLACNLSGGNQQPNTSGATAEQIALDTMVAETMQALSMQETATQAVWATTVPQGEPESTALPTIPVSTFTFTPEPTATLTPTATATFTLTPTLSSEDPKLTLGEPDFRDNFSTETNWSTYSGTADQAEITNGRFYFTMFEPLDYSIWTISWPEIDDFYLEVTATTPSACTGRDRYGLIFHAPDPTQGYIFSVSCGGEYRLSSWDGTDWEDLIDWEDDNAINVGPDQNNRIGVMVRDENIALYANGQFLEDVDDNTFSGPARFGLMIASANQNNFTVIFDDLMYWNLP